jgi:hypothetical protein
MHRGQGRSPAKMKENHQSSTEMRACSSTTGHVVRRMALRQIKTLLQLSARTRVRRVTLQTLLKIARISKNSSDERVSLDMICHAVCCKCLSRRPAECLDRNM